MHPEDQRRGLGTSCLVSTLFLPLACMTLVPCFRTQLYCPSGGRTSPLLTLSLARLPESHGNMGAPGQSTEHNHLGLSPAWFPPGFPGMVQNCLLESQPLRTDKCV